MIKKHLATTILAATVLTACATGSDPGSSSSSSLSPSSNRFSSSNKCPTGITVRVDGKAVTVTAPDPFGGAKNPGMEINDGIFSIGVNTEEVGLFELLDFDAANLRAGTFAGDKFRLTLLYSPYSESACTGAKYKRDSKFIIEKFSTDPDKKLAGCFFGKLDCDGKLVEINAAVSGVIF
jgi:hypothetical protein